MFSTIRRRLANGILVLGLIMAPLAQAEVAVITNRATGVDQLSFTDVYNAFVFSDLNWANGEPITVVIMPINSTQHRAFLEKYIGLGSLGYQRRFNMRADNSRVRKPVIVSSYLEMAETVSEELGGIGYTEDNIRSVMSKYGLVVVEVR